MSVIERPFQKFNALPSILGAFWKRLLVSRLYCVLSYLIYESRALRTLKIFGNASVLASLESRQSDARCVLTNASKQASHSSLGASILSCPSITCVLTVEARQGTFLTATIDSFCSIAKMPRVRWSETLEQDESSVTGQQITRVQKSSLKPPSMGPRRKSKAVIRKERQRQEAKYDGAEAWRERGQLYRAKLIMKDEESGGDAFTLSDQCEIEKYYDVAERVSALVGWVFSFFM